MTQSFYLLAAGLLAAQAPDAIEVLQVDHSGPIVSSSVQGCTNCGTSSSSWEWSSTSSSGGMFHGGSGGGFLSGLRGRLQGLFNLGGHGHHHQQAVTTTATEGCVGCAPSNSAAPVQAQEPPLANQTPPKAMPNGPSAPNQEPPMQQPDASPSAVPVPMTPPGLNLNGLPD